MGVSLTIRAVVQASSRAFRAIPHCLVAILYSYFSASHQDATVATHLVPFRLLRFGHLDANQEATDDPTLLTTGYYDYREAAFGLSTRRAYFILGPKGSGKSAVIEHMRLTWEDTWDRFFTRWDLRGFPVADVAAIQTGQGRGSARSQAAWEFLLLLKVFESLKNDAGLARSHELDAVFRWADSQDLLTGGTRARVSAWKAQEVRFDLKVLGGTFTKDKRSASALEASSILSSGIQGADTHSQHIIALDGLDSFYFEEDNEWTSLGGLMQAILSLNLRFKSHNLPISIVAALRSDIFDLLPGGENNKLKPNSIHLDWNYGGIGVRNHLWDLLTVKARAHHPDVTSIPNQYFSRPVAIGPHTEMKEFLLEHTRLLPRDAVALMGYIQQSYKGDSTVPEANAKQAVERYCEEYFVGEIFDNLSGTATGVSPRKLRIFQDALRSLPSRKFKFAALEAELDGELTKPQVRELLRQMFDCGGIGIYNPTAKYFDFAFRRVSGAAFTLNQELILHQALVRAWNRPQR